MTDKQSNLEDAISKLNKRYGEGAVMSGASKEMFAGEAISTGSLMLNRALGVGGFPRGRMVEIHGEESSGKTTICLSAVAQAQAKGYTAAFVDMENAVDMDYARRLGVDDSKLLISQPETGEEALEIADTLVRSGQVALLIIDSAPALITKSMVEGDIGGASYGGVARLLADALPKLKNVIKKNDTALVITNQLRADIGGWSPNGEPPVKAAAGYAIKYYADVRIKTGKAAPPEKDTVKRAEMKMEQQFIRAAIIKNKVAPPFRQAKLIINYNTGIDNLWEVSELAIELGFVKQAGAHYSYEEKKWHGKPAFLQALRSEPALYEELRGKVSE